MKLTMIESLRDDEIAAAVAGASPLDGRTLRRDAPAETWLLSMPGGQAAHGSIWWRDTPLLGTRHTGIIGHYAASNASVAKRLLDHLCARLAAHECSVAIGPMDGTTWRRYRLIVERGDEPPFFMDLDHPDDWPDHFRATGFTAIAEYFSALVDDIERVDARVAGVTERMHSTGVRIRPLDHERIDAEARAIHSLSLTAFRHAFLYSPIDEAGFLSLYRPLLPRIDPRLVLMAEHDGTLAGYVFSAADLNEAARGARMRTLVVKTIAVRPERLYAGLGALLLAQVQHNAVALGLDRAVHAMMHASNASRALSRHWHARQIRRYELFAKSLA